MQKSNYSAPDYQLGVRLEWTLDSGPENVEMLEHEEFGEPTCALPSLSGFKFK